MCCWFTFDGLVLGLETWPVYGKEFSLHFGRKTNSEVGVCMCVSKVGVVLLTGREQNARHNTAAFKSAVQDCRAVSLTYSC